MLVTELCEYNQLTIFTALGIVENITENQSILRCIKTWT